MPATGVAGIFSACSFSPWNHFLSGSSRTTLAGVSPSISARLDLPGKRCVILRLET